MLHCLENLKGVVHTFCFVGFSSSCSSVVDMVTDHLLSYRLDQTKKSVPQKEVIPANYESNDIDIELGNFLKTSTIKVDRF